jgi:polyphenol oxidase
MAFETIVADNGVTWRRSSLLHAAGIPHGFSTRVGGVSPAPFDSLNLGLADAPGEPDTWERVQENWRRFMQAVGLADRSLIRLRQVHGVGIRHADRDADVPRAQPPFADGDAMMSADRTQALSVRVADCAPVLLADSHAGLVAAVHAGWRGVVQGIVPATIRSMEQRGASAQRMIMAVGACIGGDALQVGPEVVTAMREADLAAALLPDPRDATRSLVDLRSAIALQASRSGVRSERFDVDPSCTVRDPIHFSYRRDGPRSGRMSCVIGL